MIKIILYIGFISTFLISRELITPIPLKPDFDYNKALLGKKLFFDTRLSRDNTVSCANCHILEAGGDDNLPVSFGINGKKGVRNSPTVFNARYNAFQFWDGKAKDLEEQISGPIHNPVEMGTDFKEVVSKLNKDEEYKKSFSLLYEEGINEKNIKNAIAEFEKSLTTPNSRFDRYLRGEKNVLTKGELDGFIAFKEYGCISCHNGVNVGGNLMQKVGVLVDYKSDDLGLYNLTKNIEDKYYFKVPGLRNVELTSPYFHDGSIGDLKEAVETMLKYQVGFPADEKTIENIVEFLKTLTGEMPKNIGI